MNSSNETNLTISTTTTQETPLLQQNSSSEPRIKNLKPKLLFLLRILIVLIVGFIIIYSIYIKNQKPEPENAYLSGLSKYYCHLTRHRKLCHDSMPAVVPNATELERNPARIFSSSLQLVADELNRTSLSISKSAHPSPPALSSCKALVNDSLSRLNESLELLRADLFFGSLIPYVEEHSIREEIRAVRNNLGMCFLALEKIDWAAAAGGGVGLEEVKKGVEKANKLVVNSIWLFDRSDIVLDDFYNPYSFNENEGYNFLYNYYYFFDSYGYGFDYFFLVCLFGTMYLFIGLLYWLFWQQ